MSCHGKNLVSFFVVLQQNLSDAVKPRVSCTTLVAVQCIINRIYHCEIFTYYLGYILIMVDAQQNV